MRRPPPTIRPADESTRNAADVVFDGLGHVRSRGRRDVVVVVAQVRHLHAFPDGLQVESVHAREHPPKVALDRKRVVFGRVVVERHLNVGPRRILVGVAFREALHALAAVDRDAVEGQAGRSRNSGSCDESSVRADLDQHHPALVVRLAHVHALDGAAVARPAAGPDRLRLVNVPKGHVAEKGGMSASATGMSSCSVSL